MKAICSRCKSDRLQYVQGVREYFAIESFAAEGDNWIELGDMEDTIVIDSFEPYVLCRECFSRFDIHGKEV